jgi:hypothetical protein
VEVAPPINHYFGGNVMKKVKVIYILIMLMLVFFTSCSKKIDDVNSNPKNSPANDHQGKKQTQYNNIDDLDFEGIGVEKWLSDINGKSVHPENILYVEQNKDVEFIYHFRWESQPVLPEPIAFNLMVYIDFEQVEFLIGESTDKVKKNEIQVKSNQILAIPITIPSEQVKGSRLMIAVEYAEGIPKMGEPGFLTIISLVIGEGSANMNLPEPSEAEIFSDKKDVSEIIYINQNFRSQYVEGTGLQTNTRVIEASPGELVPIAVRFTGRSGKGILFLNLDGEQMDIEGKKYLYFEDDGNILFKKLTINAPDEKGEYTLCGYYVYPPLVGSQYVVSKKLKLVVK